MKIFLLCLASMAISAQPCGQWNWANPLPQGRSYRAITQGNGLFVTVGDGGVIATSEDGIFWVPRNSGVITNLYDVAWCANQFIAVGSSGTILSSPGGETWTAVNSGVTDSLSGIAWSGSQMVAVGRALLTSSDGTVWTAQTVDTNEFLSDIYWTGSEFLIVGNDGTIVRGAGTQWAAYVLVLGGVVIYDANLRAVTGNGSEIVIVTSRGFLYSEDGQQYEQVGYSGYNDITWGSGKFIAVGNEGMIAVSDNGREWSEIQTEEELNPLTSIAYQDGFVAVGESGRIFTSKDSAAWSPRWYSATKDWVYKTKDLGTVAGGPNGYVAAGVNGVLLFSKDGAFWTAYGQDDANWFTASIWAQDTFIVAGKNGAIFTSPDGSAWTTRSSGTSSWLTDAVSGNGSVILVGQSGTVLKSSDGKQWQKHTSGTGDTLNGITWTGSEFVAVTTNQTLKSPDGTSWTITAEAGAAAIAGNGTLLVAVARNKIMLSSDGTSWTEQAAGPGTWFEDIAWDGNRFVAVGDDGVIGYSTNGSDWELENSPFNYVLEGLFLDDKQIIAVGWTGTILRQICHVPETTTIRIPQIKDDDGARGWLSLVNPNASSAQFRITGFKENGTQAKQSGWHALAPQGQFWIGMEALFPNADLDWITVESQGTLDAIIELRGEGRRSAYKTVNAIDLAYVPHIAQNTGLFQTVIATIHQSDATLIKAFPSQQEVSLNTAAQNYTKSLYEVSQLWDDLSQVNWAEISAESPSLTCMEYFSYLDGSRRMAALELDKVQGKTLRFLHIATNRTQFWTGMVYINQGNAQAQITETYYADTGEILGQEVVSLAVDQKETLLFDSRTQGRIPDGAAWMQCDSDQNLLGYELFGSANGSDNKFFAGIQCSLNSGTVLDFGHFAAGGEAWVGYVAVNVGTQTADLSFHLMDHFGKEIAQTTIANIGPNQKITVLGADLFPINEQQQQGAWVYARGSASQWDGFCLWGDHNVPQREFMSGVNATIRQ